MSSEVRIPLIPLELLEYLEKVFPDRCPDPSCTNDEVRVRMGEQKVVRHLRAKFDLQQKNILKA